MADMDKTILGINHMFLYPESMVNGDVHTASLRDLSQISCMDALDCWVWTSHAKEELKILKESGKIINYNIGDRFEEKPILPSTADAKERVYARDILRRECDFALECGAKKIIFGSGRAASENREDSLKRFVDFVLEWGESLPEDVCLCLEPTDWDIDKFALLGKLEDTVQCVETIRNAGQNIGILLDMGHIPIMYETLESAVKKAAPYLRHIHMGNCVIQDKMHPLYGDKHPCWGYEGGEYDEKDGAVYIQELIKNGYFSNGCAQTMSFEMRPLTGMNAEETAKYLAEWYKRTI